MLRLVSLKPAAVDATGPRWDAADTTLDLPRFSTLDTGVVILPRKDAVMHRRWGLQPRYAGSISGDAPGECGGQELAPEVSRTPAAARVARGARIENLPTGGPWNRLPSVVEPLLEPRSLNFISTFSPARVTTQCNLAPVTPRMTHKLRCCLIEVCLGRVDVSDREPGRYQSPSRTGFKVLTVGTTMGANVFMVHRRRAWLGSGSPRDSSAPPLRHQSPRTPAAMPCRSSESNKCGDQMLRSEGGRRKSARAEAA